MNQQKQGTVYKNEQLNHIAYPMGGTGAGMICLNGRGNLRHFSLQHKPALDNNPEVFAALHITNGSTLIVEGEETGEMLSGGENFSRGSRRQPYGRPRFKKSSFSSRFPFATVDLQDDRVPLTVRITGWSPFIPNDEDNSGLPVAGVEYTLHNPGDTAVEGSLSLNMPRLFGTRQGGFTAKEDEEVEGQKQGIHRDQSGFTIFNCGNCEHPEQEGYFHVATDAPSPRIDVAWFRGRSFDYKSVLWNQIASGTLPDTQDLKDGAPSPGASLHVPFSLDGGEKKTIRFRLAWYVPFSLERKGSETEFAAMDCCSSKKEENYRPWYSNRFEGIDAVADYWNSQYDELKKRTELFTDTFYQNTLPEEITDAVAANLSILKSPTVLRQYDGRIWGWEGCNDDCGCCAGSCTHVWNYAQAIAHLFPRLERTLRETEFIESLCADGWQTFRVPLPVVQISSDDPQSWGKSQDVAVDGQCGTLIKMYRDWRISGDTDWIASHWEHMTRTLDFCIRHWDPDEQGCTPEPQHNTYDIEFWGPNGFASSYYLAALKSVILIGEALGKETRRYERIFDSGRSYMENELYNGEFFIQKVVWEGLRAGNPVEADSLLASYSEEAKELMEKEGPKYQYGGGCLADGVIGAWMAATSGIDDSIFDGKKIESHLQAVYDHNFKPDLRDNITQNRPGFALNNEGGLLLCTWPRGDALTLPFTYSSEVWTGIEYQVASHLMSVGKVQEGLDIVRTCRARFDGTKRNPFNEYECGHWYARAMSSYALLQGITGIRYDAVEKTLYINPQIDGDFRSFISTATGFGTAGIKDDKPFIEVVEGEIQVEKISYTSGE